MTENNYVIKDTSKHEIFNQCWADVGPAAQTLGQHQPSIGSMSRVCRDCLSQAVTHSGEGPQQRRDIEHVLGKCWPIGNDAGPTLKQHKGNITCLLGGGGGAHGANRSVTIQPDEEVTDLIVCIHLGLTLPLPQQRAVVVICSAKAVSAHL